MRSLGDSSTAEELDIDKLRFKAIGSSLGVVAVVRPGLCGAGPLATSVFHRRSLLTGSLFPGNA